MMNNNIQIADIIDQTVVSEAHICVPETCLSKLNTTQNKLTILCQNIRSTNANLTGFELLLKRINFLPNIIVLTECWLSVKDAPFLNNYSTFSTKNLNNRSEGVAVYITNSLLCTSYEPTVDGANCMVTIIDNEIAIVAIYRSPSYSSSADHETFRRSLEQILTPLDKFKHIIVTGDININICQNSKDKYASQYLDLVASFGLLPAHIFPTRKRACLDHVLIKSKSPSTTLVVENTLTDHSATILSLTLKVRSTSASKKVTKINYDTLGTQLRATDFSKMYQLNCNDCASYFVRTLGELVKSSTNTIVLPRRKIILKPWITPGLVRCMRNRDAMHRNLQNNPDNPIIKETYRRYRNFCNTIIKKAKIIYDRTELQKVSKTNPKKTWEIIKSVTNYKTTPPQS